MKKIIFRADGNSQTGLGHLYRLFALVEIYKTRFECVFLTRENSHLAVIPKEYDCRIIPNTVSILAEPNWIHQHYPSEMFMMIGDGYQFTSSYQKQIKSLGYTLFYVDDYAIEHQFADVVINHSLFIKSTDYNREIYTQLALGTEYAMLRPGFLNAAKNKRNITKIESIFICFGGADPHDLSVKAIQAALRFSEIKKIHVVIGAAYLHQEIFELEKNNARLKVYQNLNEQDLKQVMQACDLAIAPASNILYELCAVKMPILSGFYVENQKNIYKGCIEHKIIIDGGNFENYTVKDFEAKLIDILKSNNFQTYIDAQSTLFDSKIGERFLNLIPIITYRKAGVEDMMLLYEWANDPVSRANSYFTEPILLETHKAWFDKKIKEKTSMIFIAEIDNNAAGMIRFDVGENHSVVGISVAENYRGKGLASHFLIDTSKIYFSKYQLPILAYIKKENLASIKSFQKANYVKLKEEIVNGSDSFVYQLIKA